MQQDHLHAREVLAQLGDEPFRGIVFAIIFLAAILLGDGLWKKGNTVFLSG
ncbi:hypothetical protein [Thiothrix winogradskyi]|uniref:Uncharacterized protein n=1 Tax=Thiothrix winogradskyi TaxID=96472 RepID=A0ABY3SWP7_9GAMM|nr:hypothetical protein [Thiothrix winogradskyi]UJS22669.1 hypothetical protein L2Y54_12005 [Thiothrix winogradskyi]UJS23916.1 hypothetical protein L2Y54_18555 [Thiothrix winogradskyi]